MSTPLKTRGKRRLPSRRVVDVVVRFKCPAAMNEKAIPSILEDCIWLGSAHWNDSPTRALFYSDKGNFTVAVRLRQKNEADT